MDLLTESAEVACSFHVKEKQDQFKKSLSLTPTLAAITSPPQSRIPIEARKLQQWTGFEQTKSLVLFFFTVGMFFLFSVSQTTWLRPQATGGEYWFERDRALGLAMRVHVWSSIREFSGTGCDYAAFFRADDEHFKLSECCCRSSSCLQWGGNIHAHIVDAGGSVSVCDNIKYGYFKPYNAH
jgi:hypothetical protein